MRKSDFSKVALMLKKRKKKKITVADF